MKNIEKAVILGFIITLLVTITGFKANCENIEKKVFRLHILANSDLEEDQNLKIKVRDRILDYASIEFKDAKTKEEAIKLTHNDIDKIQEIAQDEIFSNGFNYPVSVEIKNTHFNTRSYDKFKLPAGNYDALKVKIGSGKGQNWWCVMFPPMCLSAAEEKEELGKVLDDDELDIVSNGNRYEIRFKVVELFENFKDWISN